MTRLPHAHRQTDRIEVGAPAWEAALFPVLLLGVLLLVVLAGPQ